MDFPTYGAHLPVLSVMSKESWGGQTDQAPSAGTSSTYPTANKAIFVPLAIRSPYLIRKLWWYNGTAVAGNVDAGVYTLGGARLVSTGSTAQATINVIQSVTLGTPFLLTPGSYYLALSCSSTTAQFRRRAPTAIQMRFAGLAEMASALPLPDPATLAVATVAYVPFFGIASAGVI